MRSACMCLLLKKQTHLCIWWQYAIRHDCRMRYYMSVCTLARITLNYFLSFFILIWADLFILPFCFVFLTGLIAPFCPIFVSVKGPGRKLSLPTDLKTDLGTVGRKRADLFLYSCIRCINFLCFHPVENDMMKPLAFYSSYLMHFYSFTFFSFEFMTWC